MHLWILQRPPPLAATPIATPKISPSLRNHRANHRLIIADLNMPAKRALANFPAEVASHSKVGAGSPPPRRSRAHARTMNAAAASVASVPVFSVFRRHLPPPRWLSTSPCRGLPLAAHDACGPVAPSRARRSSATRARRCTSTAPSRSPSPSAMLSTPISTCVRALTAAPHRTSGRPRTRCDFFALPRAAADRTLPARFSSRRPRLHC